MDRKREALQMPLVSCVSDRIKPYAFIRNYKS